MLDNQMSKSQFSELLKKLNIPVSEAISRDEDKDKYPKIVYQETDWSDFLNVKEDYGIAVTYEVALYSKKPRDLKLKELRDLLRSTLGFKGKIYHRFNDKEKIFKSYLYIEVFEIWQG